MPAFGIRSMWCEAGGYRIHYRFGKQSGEGPPGRPLVLVHGLVVSSRYMIPLATRLAADQDVYAPDLPGYGRSEKPETALSVPRFAEALGAWLDEVGLDRPSFLGNSFGCQILAEFAARRPERVDHLVFVGPTMDPHARSALRQTVRSLRSLRHEPRSYPLVLVRDYADAGLARAREMFDHALEHRTEELLPRIEAPTMVVRGTRDPIVPQRWAEEAARLLPDGTLKIIPGAGHAINYGAPLELHRVTRPFLQENRATWRHDTGTLEHLQSPR